MFIASAKRYSWSEWMALGGFYKYKLNRKRINFGECED